MSVQESPSPADARPVLRSAVAHAAAACAPARPAFPFGAVADVPCFTAGTLIRTPQGSVPIESLAAGDLVATLDHGAQPLRWIGKTVATARGLQAPVVFAAGALDNDTPLIMSPEHRVLLTGWRSAMVAGTQEVFAAAKDLVNGRDVTRCDHDEITYLHLAFDQHQIVCTAGAYSESFHPETLKPQTMSVRTRAHLIAAFPSLGVAARTYGPHARPQVQSYEARLIRP